MALPLEVMQRIIEGVYLDDTPTLLSASLTCKGLSGVAQRRLFSQPHIKVWTKHEPDLLPLVSFTVAVSTHPHLAATVQSLTVVFDAQRSHLDDEDEIAKICEDQLCGLLGHLPALRSFSLSSYRKPQDDFHFSRRILDSMGSTKLESLHLKSVYFHIPIAWLNKNRDTFRSLALEWANIELDRKSAKEEKEYRSNPVALESLEVMHTNWTNLKALGKMFSLDGHLKHFGIATTTDPCRDSTILAQNCAETLQSITYRVPFNQFEDMEGPYRPYYIHEAARAAYDALGSDEESGDDYDNDKPPTSVMVARRPFWRHFTALQTFTIQLCAGIGLERHIESAIRARMGYREARKRSAVNWAVDKIKNKLYAIPNLSEIVLHFYDVTRWSLLKDFVDLEWPRLEELLGKKGIIPGLKTSRFIIQFTFRRWEGCDDKEQAYHEWAREFFKEMKARGIQVDVEFRYYLYWFE